jgi:hypothetical protein
MWDLCRLLWQALVGLFRSRAALEAENLVLRQQVIVLRRTMPRKLVFSSIDRLIFVGRYRALSKPLVASSVCRSWVDCIINIAGFDLRQAQVTAPRRCSKRRTGVMAEVMRAVSTENEDTKLYLFCGLGYCED